MNVYDLLGHEQVLLTEAAARKLSEALAMTGIYDVIKRPLVTEKGVTKKDGERTLCFEVAAGGQQDPDPAGDRSGVQGEGGGSAHVDHCGQSCGGAGVFPAIVADWKKAYVRLKAGEKMPEYAEI